MPRAVFASERMPRDRVSGEDKPTKTKHALRFSLEPTILSLLQTMHAFDAVP